MSEDTVSDSQAAKPVKGRGLVWLIAICLLIVGGWYGYKKWSFDKHHVYTDNAQVDGRIVKVLSPETGYVEKLPVANNQPVKRGELLLKLSDDFYRLEVQRAQAQYNIVQSRLGDEKSGGLAQAQQASAQAHLEVLQSQLAQAEADAKQAADSYQRMQLQFKNNNINQSQLDMSKASNDQASAHLLTLQKEVYEAQQELIEEQASGKLEGFGLDSAKAELAQARQRLDYTSITSPLDGVVAKMLAEPGTLVEPGQYLMSVVSLSDVWIVANIKESDFLKVKRGASVTVTIDAYPGQTFQGVVNSTSPATGGMFALIPKDNASGNFIKVPALIPVRIDFVGLPQAQYRLLPGMSAEVQIEIIDKPIEQSTDAAEKKSDGQSSTKDDSNKETDTKTAASEKKATDAKATSGEKQTGGASSSSTASSAQSDMSVEAQEPSPADSDLSQ